MKILDKNHPGFADKDYITRRNTIAHIAQQYSFPNVVPDVPYTQQEHQLWNDIRIAIHPIHLLNAHSSYLSCLDTANLPLNHIPQLSEINRRLNNITGYQLTPVEGLIDARTFMAALAQRRMLCAQYIRHYSVPHYTPEPDVVHELIGHAIPFFSKEYCDFNDLFGKAAINASDEQMISIERLYWYTIEFGLIKENNSIKAYGAGLLSSIGELTSITDVPHRPFNITDIINTPYDTQSMQPALFCANSYNQIIDETSEWLNKIS